MCGAEYKYKRAGIFEAYTMMRELFCTDVGNNDRDNNNPWV